MHKRIDVTSENIASSLQKLAHQQGDDRQSETLARRQSGGSKFVTVNDSVIYLIADRRCVPNGTDLGGLGAMATYGNDAAAVKR
jgi:hypothetical protein